MSAVDATQTWQAERGRLFGLAYRMLGSVTETEDVLQETWLRWDAADRDAIVQPGAWLTTVTTRLCLDQLRSARAKRESYVGPWLPEPLVTAPDIAERIELADTLQMALLVVLETLSPLERAVFVLREVFGFDHAEVARTIGRSDAAVRQLAHRAREHVAARRPRFDPDPDARRRVTEEFLAACATGDLDALVAVLAPDVTLHSDGGGVVTAARKPVHGAERVARFLLGIVRMAPPDTAVRLVQLNGEPGIVAEADGRPLTALVLQVVDDRVAGIKAVVNPDKLRALRLQPNEHRNR